MSTINASSSTVIPQATYGTYWISTLVINNKNPAKPTAIISFQLSDVAGNPAPNTQPITVVVDIMAAIIAGDTDLAALFAAVVAKCGQLGISSGRLPASLV